MERIAVYGTLKKGFYNHRWLGENPKFLGTDTVSGSMYMRHESYPVLVIDGYLPQGNYHGSEFNRIAHEIEVYEVSDERYRAVAGMEMGAGYDVTNIQTKYGTASIFTMFLRDITTQDTPIEAFTKELYE